MNQKGAVQIIFILLLLLGIGIAVYLTQFTQVFKPKADNTPKVAKEHLIGKTMINGKPFLYNQASGRIFIPRGGLYDDDPAVSLAQSVNISYDPARIDRDLAKMESDGYNSVRTAVRPWTIGNTTGPGLNPQVLDNLVDFLTKAKKHNIFVHLQVGNWPTNPISGYDPTPSLNDQYRSYKEGQNGLELTDSGYPNFQLLSPVALEARKKFLNDLFVELKARNAPLEYIWTYDLGEGELAIKLDNKPFAGIEGMVETNAGTFDMSNLRIMSEQQRIDWIKDLADKSVVKYADTLTDVIKSHDPTALVSFQMFPPVLHTPPGQGVKNLYVPAKWMMASPDMKEGDLHGSKIDVAGLSLYPNYDNYNFECQISSLQIPGVGGGCGYGLNPGTNTKPLYVMEMGYNFRNPSQGNAERASDIAQELVNWMRMECTAGIRGWMLFTWNFPREYGNYFNAFDDNEAINNAIKPANLPNVCNDDLDMTVPAANSGPNSVPIHAFVQKNDPQNVYYVASEAEKDKTLKSGEWYYFPDRWYASNVPGPGLKPVYGFSLKRYGGYHMYTTSEEEKEFLSKYWDYQGILWYAYENPPQTDSVPVYRFKSSTSDDLHFFVAEPQGYDETGKRNMQANGWIIENNGNPVWYGTKSYVIDPEASDSSPSPSAGKKVGDIDNDGDVDIADYNLLLGDYFTGNLRSDVDANGKVDIFDFNALISNFGR